MRRLLAVFPMAFVGLFAFALPAFAGWGEYSNFTRTPTGSTIGQVDVSIGVTWTDTLVSNCDLSLGGTHTLYARIGSGGNYTYSDPLTITQSDFDGDFRTDFTVYGTNGTTYDAVGFACRRNGSLIGQSDSFGDTGFTISIPAPSQGPLIPYASATQMIVSTTTGIWGAFYEKIPLIVGVVVLFTIVIHPPMWLIKMLRRLGQKG